MTTMTYTDALSFVLSNCSMPDDVRAKLTKLAEQTSKPRAKSDKPDAKTVENAALRSEIHAILLDNMRPMTIPEIVSSIVGEYKAPVTAGRVSALLTRLKNDNKVVRTEVKRIAHFAIAEDVQGE